MKFYLRRDIFKKYLKKNFPAGENIFTLYNTAHIVKPGLN